MLKHTHIHTHDCTVHEAPGTVKIYINQDLKYLLVHAQFFGIPPLKECIQVHVNAVCKLHCQPNITLLELND